MSKSQDLWKRAKSVMPGGTSLLSKRPEMLLPESWPSYFTKSDGCRLWDLDGREFNDLFLMGVGTNLLGYSRPEVDEAVRQTVNDGNMTSLNCAEEVLLAERLVEMHGWSDMVRFARSGGEANAISVRIARAASGRDGVAFCGYHGWHDWYLSANLTKSETLGSHLLSGLSTNGVPAELEGTVFGFAYNNFDELAEIVSKQSIGVIKMEVQRNIEPAPGFLEAVRKLASDNGIVLIFDECTAGFRETFGGLHKKYGVEPDIATFGKALGNGYAITAVLGRREVMEAAQDTFISSTFWTERIGPTAALATLDVMEREASWEAVSQAGRGIKAKWRELAESLGLEVAVGGLDALPSFTFAGGKDLEFKTYITQEMLAKGWLAGTAVYMSLAHTPDIIDRYFRDLETVWSVLKECQDGRPVEDLLKGPVCHAGFQRLN